MGKTLLDLLADAIDNDTLIIVGLIIIGIWTLETDTLSKEQVAIVSGLVGGFLGYIRGKGTA